MREVESKTYVLVLIMTSLLLASGCKREPPAAPAVSGAQERELKRVEEERWAKEVAEAFLKTLGDERQEQEQVVLTTRSFQERHKDQGGILRGYRDVRFTSGGAIKSGVQECSLAPELDEAILKGSVYSKELGPVIVGNFTMQVVKEKASGKWRVNSFSVTKP